MAQALKELGRSLNDAWHAVSEGWRELLSRCGSALTKFSRKTEGDHAMQGMPAFPKWGLLAGEVIDRDKSVVVQLELPGISRDDCDISITDRMLRIRGEKRTDREHIGDSYYVMERAYGSFERVIPLPADVDDDSACASLRNGILKVELKKHSSPSRRLVRVK